MCPTDLGWRPMDAVFKIMFWWEWILKVSWWSASPLLSLTCSVTSARWLTLSVPLCLVCKIELFFYLLHNTMGRCHGSLAADTLKPKHKGQVIGPIESLTSQLVVVSHLKRNQAVKSKSVETWGIVVQLLDSESGRLPGSYSVDIRRCNTAKGQRNQNSCV